AAQRAIPARPGQHFFRPGEMVQADKLVSGLSQTVDRQQVQVQGQVSGGKVGGAEDFLPAENLGNDRQPVKGDAVGGEGHDLVQGLGHGAQCLEGEAVNQVEIERLKTQLPAPADHLFHQLHRLEPVDRALDVRGEVLDAKADAVEAQAAQGLELLQA